MRPRLAPITPGSRPRLRDRDAVDPRLPHGEDAEAALVPLVERLTALQQALYAEARHALLVVLQGRDASGKDGLTRKVFGPLDSQGCVVTNFKQPTAHELAHDYLWRVHHAMPPKGTIGIFNRSHYEDVLVVRVHDLVPRAEWSARYEQINAFERMLTRNGVTILKFCLHISKAEQRQRLLDRLDDPTKNWKFQVGDLGERDRWDAYTRAYEDVLRKTSTAWAPWYVVPADRKKSRDLVVAEVVVEALERMRPRFPAVDPTVLATVRRWARASAPGKTR